MEMENLVVLDSLPEEFFKLSAQGLFKIFDGPTLIHLKSQTSDRQPIFISTLLHGNEHSGIMALQELLPQYMDNLPCDLIILIGNIKAAKYGKRHLDTQPDFNRVWITDNPFVVKTLDYIKSHNVEYCIDLHNNTGNNPCYSCISQEDPIHYNLAKMFSDKIVFFTDPIEALSVVLSKNFPSMTIEAGKSGDREGIRQTVSFLKKLINGIEIEDMVEEKPIVYHTVGKIKVDPNEPITFHKDEYKGDGYLLRDDLDQLNFDKTTDRTLFGEGETIFIIEPHVPGVKSEDYFVIERGNIFCKKEFIPAMLTKDIEIIYSDGLGYVMEEYELKL